MTQSKLSQDPALKDFRNFLWLCWQSNGLPEPTQPQYEIADFLQHGPDRSKEPWETPNDRLFIAAARGWGKSWISGAFALWTLYWNPRANVLVTSAAKQKSDEFSTYCQGLLKNVPILAAMVPKDPMRWSKIAFDVSGAADAAQAASVKSIGIFGQLTGSRADLIIADDIETPKTAETQHQRERLEERSREFSAVLSPKGRVVYLGTPQDEDSIYNRLPAKGYSRRFWPARYPKASQVASKYGDDLAPSIAEKCEELEGQPTEPKRFGDDELWKREADGASYFQLQFMLDTTLSDEERYPLKLRDLVVLDIDGDLAPEKVIWSSSPDLALKLDEFNVGFRGDRYYRPMWVSEIRRPYTGSVMFIDPSGRGKDETGYAVVKMLNGFLYVPAWGGYIGGYGPEVLAALAATAVEQKVNRVLVETNLGGGMFGELLKPYLRKAATPAAKLSKGLLENGITVEEVRSTGQKERRIADVLEPVMNQHRLVISPRVIEQDFRKVPEDSGDSAASYRGCYQLSRLTRDRGCLKHDDRIDALSGAVAYWVLQMAQDVDERVQFQRDEDRQKDIDDFMEHALGRKTTKEATWMSSILGN